MENNSEAIRQAVELYGDMIYRLALHYLKDSFDAEDVVQEVLLALFLRDIPENRRKAWLLRVTINKSLDVLRKRKRQRPLEAEPSAGHGEGMSLSEELKELSALDRELVYLYWYEGYSSKEIGKLVKMSDGAVRKRLERAKKKLRELLEKDP